MPTHTTTAGGAALRDLRRELGLTQDQMSAKTGVNQGYISWIETGRRPLTGSVALRITMKLGVDPMRLAQHVQIDDAPTGPPDEPFPPGDLAGSPPGPQPTTGPYRAALAHQQAQAA